MTTYPFRFFNDHIASFDGDTWGGDDALLVQMLNAEVAGLSAGYWPAWERGRAEQTAARAGGGLVFSDAPTGDDLPEDVEF